MPQELTTQELLDAFADEVARELGTHCRTAPLPEYKRGLARLIVDGEGRALRLCQPDNRRPDRLKIYAALQDETRMAPSIGVTTHSARHVAREIAQRLHPLHTEAANRAAELTTRQQAEENGRRAVAKAVAASLPGARVEEQYRRTRILWEHASQPSGQPGPVRTYSLCATVGPSGEWVTVEASGPPDRVIPMLAAFTQAPRE